MTQTCLLELRFIENFEALLDALVNELPSPLQMFQMALAIRLSMLLKPRLPLKLGTAKVTNKQRVPVVFGAPLILALLA